MKMLGFLKSWFLSRELVALSFRSDFEGVEASKVSRLLESVAQQYQHRFTRPRDMSTVPDLEMRDALARIWELSRERYRDDRQGRLAWHRVMASCNTLYTQCVGAQTSSQAKRRAA